MLKKELQDSVLLGRLSVLTPDDAAKVLRLEKELLRFIRVLKLHKKHPAREAIRAFKKADEVRK